jgi:hypothetical protein
MYLTGYKLLYYPGETAGRHILPLGTSMITELRPRSPFFLKTPPINLYILKLNFEQIDYKLI